MLAKIPMVEMRGQRADSGWAGPAFISFGPKDEFK